MTKKPSDRYDLDPNAVLLDEGGVPDDPKLFDALLAAKFPREAALKRQLGMDRRSFMKIMGASLALAGFGAAGCTQRPPDEPIIPYVRLPEEVIPGRSLFFSSSMILGGVATGVLIETFAGRPTRLDGNPLHPASLGASNTYLQGAILELYNPERSSQVLHNGEENTWENFLATLEPLLADGDGSGIRVLTEAVTSPTLAMQLQTMQEVYPGFRWYQYDPVSQDNVMAGSALAFDEPVNTVYRFDQADVILSLDSDFLLTLPGSLRYTHDFIERRKVRGGPNDAAMNRLYMVESSMTITGAKADHRLALSPTNVEAFTRALASALGVEGGADLSGPPWDETWFNTLVDDLQAAGANSLVVAGEGQSAVVHALAHAINAALGNVGTTVVYTEPIFATPEGEANDLAALAEEIRSRDVEALIILGGNPVYDAPADVDFTQALDDVSLTVHLSMYYDETSRLCDWHIPQTHFVEAWSDARAYDGTLSVIQPPIGPLYPQARSVHDIMGVLLGDTRPTYQVVRQNWQQVFSQGDFEESDFEAFWRRTLHDGFAQNSAAASVEPSLRGGLASDIEEQAASGGDGLQIVFRIDPNLYDGRFANNSWLQEIPHPITKIVWDNAALISPATADDLGVETNDLVRLAFRGREIDMPVWVTPGHPDNTVTTFLGYGRGLSAELDEDRNFSAYQIRPSDAMWFGTGLEVRDLNERYELALIRGDIDVDNLDGYVDTPVRSASLSQYRENPDFVHEGEAMAPLPSLFDDEWDYSEGYSWGMAIDLTACVGCNACIIACQAENNIPTVGKAEVMRAREMHWLRVDRYFDESEDGPLQTSFLPVPCMHCETAPCELVCPVEATLHDSEGLNSMIYNRCIGTRYCSANCPYNVRHFNFFDYRDEADVLVDMRNPNVSVRPEGVMEKCTYCVQRINEARIDAVNEDRLIRDGEAQPACAVACPANAISFGNLNDSDAQINAWKEDPLEYGLLVELGTKPRTTYLARLINPNGAIYQPEEEEE